MMSQSRARWVVVVLIAWACDSDGAAQVGADGSSDRRMGADAGPRDGLPVDSGAAADAGEDAKQAEFRALAESFCRAVCDCSYLGGDPRDNDCTFGIVGCCTVWASPGFDSCVDGEIRILNQLDASCSRWGDRWCGCDWLELCKEHARTITCDPETSQELGIPVECFEGQIPVEEQCCTDPNFGRCDKPL